VQSLVQIGNITKEEEERRRRRKRRRRLTY
jgi:hypothetical protein